MAEESAPHKNKLEVCHSPALFEAYFDDPDCVVVVIDVFRATSAMVTAFAHGIKEMIPVAELDEALEYQKKGFEVAAERKGEKLDGFKLGNSPFDYMSEDIKDASIVITTTNGTQAVEKAKNANHLLIGSFLNLSAICDKLEELDKDVILLCAGWKNRFNLEDTLFAGAVVDELTRRNIRFSDLSDSAISAKFIYNHAKENLFKFLENSSHRKRLSRLNMEEDILFCLTIDKYSIVPELIDGKIILPTAKVEA